MRKSYVVRDGVLVDKSTVPPPERKGPNIIPDIQPYQAVGPEFGKVISSRSRHREYLKKHGLVEIGNQKPKWMRND